jgi:hypothetical protein
MTTLAEGGKIWNPGSKSFMPPKYAKLIEGIFVGAGIVSMFFYFLLAVMLRIFGDFVIHITDQKALTITTDGSAYTIMSWLAYIAPIALVFGLYLMIERKSPQKLPVKTIAIMGAPQRFRERTVFAFSYCFILLLLLPYIGGTVTNAGSRERDKVSAIQEWASDQTGLQITTKEANAVYEAAKKFPVTGNYVDDLSRVEIKSIKVGKNTIKFSISHSSENIVVFKVNKAQ